MGLKAAERQYDKLHEDTPFHDGTFKSWRKEFSRSHPYHYLDGVQIWMAQVDVQPWDEFLSDVNASPVEPTDPSR